MPQIRRDSLANAGTDVGALLATIAHIIKQKQYMNQVEQAKQSAFGPPVEVGGVPVSTPRPSAPDVLPSVVGQTPGGPMTPSFVQNNVPFRDTNVQTQGGGGQEAFMRALANMTMNPAAQQTLQQQLALRPQHFSAAPGSQVFTQDFTGNVRPEFQVPDRQVQKNSIEIPTGKPAVKKDGFYYEEVVPADPVSREPLPGAKPYLKLRGQESIGSTQASLGNSWNWNATGEDFLRTVDPKFRSTIKGITNYTTNPQTLSFRGGERDVLLRAANQYDPTYDQAQYNVRYGVRKDFTSGPTSKRINSLNTVAGHLDDLDRAIDALNTGNIKLLNSIANQYKVQTGGSAPVVFNAIKNAVAGELGSIFKSGGGQAAATDPEIANVGATLENSLSPDVLKQVVTSDVGLIRSRLDALQNQYERGMGKPIDFKILSPKAESVFNRLGGQAGAQQKYSRTATNPQNGQKVGYNEQTGQWEPIQ